MTITTFGILATVGTVYVNNVSKKRSKVNEISFMGSKSLKPTIAEKFWKCFSLKENFQFIMSTKISKSSIAPIHGIRALGALWIIAGHVYYYAFGPLDNVQLIFAYADAWILQPLFAAAISVDSFYVMR